MLIWSAAVASSAIPGVFRNVSLLAKNHVGIIKPYSPEGLKFSDGSVENDLPTERLSELFNVNHFIASQVNIHARLLAPVINPRKVNHQSMTPRLFLGLESAYLKFIDYCRDQVRSSFKNFSKMLIQLPVGQSKLFRKVLVPLLTQKYAVDINIVPSFTLAHVRSMV